MSLLHEGGLFFCFVKTLQLRFSFDGVHLITPLIDLIFVAGGFFYAFVGVGVNVDKYKSHDTAISKGPPGFPSLTYFPPSFIFQPSFDLFLTIF